MGLRLFQIISVGMLFALTAQAAEQSSFAEVSQVILDANTPMVSEQVAAELEVYRQGKLPQYPMNMHSIFEFGSGLLERSAQRTIYIKDDYFDRLPKLLHPNGVCVMGRWQIYDNSPYSGAFASATQNLFVGRISVAMQETTKDASRGFGFAGKLFPTLSETEKVSTENLFTVDVLMGTKTQRFLDTATTNEPDLGFDFGLLKLGLKIASALKKADENPGFRPVKNLASMGVNPGIPIRYPHWIRLSAASSTIKNNQADFRSEVLQAVKDNGELVFYIDGSETTSDRKSRTGWKRLGEVRVSEAVVSYGCDRRLHFAHPKLK